MNGIYHDEEEMVHLHTPDIIRTNNIVKK